MKQKILNEEENVKSNGSDETKLISQNILHIISDDLLEEIILSRGLREDHAFELKKKASSIEKYKGVKDNFAMVRLPYFPDSMEHWNTFFIMGRVSILHNSFFNLNFF